MVIDSQKLDKALIIYDSQCDFCKAVKNITKKWIISNGEKIMWLPFDSDPAAEILNTLDEDRYESVIYIPRDGNLLRYQDAVIEILKLNNRLKPFITYLAKYNLTKTLLRKSYVWIARHRDLAYRLIPKSYRD